MANFYGADVEQLHHLARELRTQAESLDSITARLTARIVAVEWHGPDAQRFQGEWSDHLSRTLRQVAHTLRDVSATADRNARAQSFASGGGQ